MKSDVRPQTVASTWATAPTKRIVAGAARRWHTESPAWARRVEPQVRRGVAVRLGPAKTTVGHRFGASCITLMHHSGPGIMAGRVTLPTETVY